MNDKETLRRVTIDIKEMINNIQLKYSDSLKISVNSNLSRTKKLQIQNPLKFSKNLLFESESEKNLQEKMEKSQKINFLSSIENSKMIKNLVWNSFLQNSNHQEDYLNQLIYAVKGCLKEVPNQKYSKENIFKLINIQAELKNCQFHKLSNKIKLRVICVIFAKYVNRNNLIILCKSFMNDINLTKNSKIWTFIKR